MACKRIQETIKYKINDELTRGVKCMFEELDNHLDFDRMSRNVFETLLKIVLTKKSKIELDYSYPTLLLVHATLDGMMLFLRLLGYTILETFDKEMLVLDRGSNISQNTWNEAAIVLMQNIKQVSKCRVHPWFFESPKITLESQFARFRGVSCTIFIFSMLLNVFVF